MSLILDGSNGITFPNSSTQAVGFYGFKNRIINGAMVIDQRNAGASVTPTGGAYTLDRWSYDPSGAYSWFSFQQNAGSITPPVGFSNYLGATSTGANTPSAGQFSALFQRIEGFNTADLQWGTANAKTVTLSFWVYSSLTGTFGGAINNGASSRSYPFTFVISSANTWTQASVTIAGDTSGTWVGATNGIGMTVNFNLGSGSTYSGTAGAWASAWYKSATGAVNISATSGATFYITGDQLEVGSTATSFDYRPYGTELALCQRYYFSGQMNFTIPGTLATATNGQQYFMVGYQLPVSMRATPTCGPSGSNVLTGYTYNNQTLNLQWGYTPTNQNAILKLDSPAGGNFSTPLTASAEL